MSLFVKPALLTAAGALLVAAKAPEARTVHYSARPVMQRGSLSAIEVEMRFRGDADGETVLEMPTRWAGSNELWRNAEDLEIRGVRRLTGDYSRPVLHHRPGARIRVNYRVTTAYDGDPGYAYEKARPIVRPGWFFVHGEGVFAVPAGRAGSPASFRWGRFPRNWKVASDLDHLKDWRTTVVNIVDSVAIGGTDLTVLERTVGRAPLRVAIRGQWGFTPEALTEVVEKIVRAEDQFWGDESTPFLVAMAPLGHVSSGLSSTGTGRTDAFSIASTDAFDLATAKRFLGHEYMHSWMPQALGLMPEKDEAVDYWLSEGFSDFLASRILLRSGLWSLEDYASDKNETLRRHTTSPARTASAADIAAGFWSNDSLQQLSYDRGHLFATILDMRIRERSGGTLSLDDVLRAQRERAKAAPDLASRLLPQVMLEVAGVDAAAEIEKHMRAGEPLVLPSGTIGSCGQIASVKVRDFDRGYDATATRLAGDLLTGVAPDGPAFAAGLRNGMRLMRRESGKFGDSTIEVAYRVADANGERLVRYLPEGKKEFDVQQMVLAPMDEGQRAGCVRMLGGVR